MAPSVPGRVVWWGGQASIGEALAPIRLAFEFRAVAGSALLGVDHLAPGVETALVTNDLNGDGVVNVADVQKVINAALGLGCNLP